ncbi:unnamed protein product [Parajaminaea phylloscopi]
MSSSTPNRGGTDDDLNPFQIPDDMDHDGSADQQRADRTDAEDTAETATITSTRPPSYHEQEDRPFASTSSLDTPVRTPSSAQPSQSHTPMSAPNIDMSTVTIVDAQKTTDHVGASSFIVYVIRTGSSEAKRRYSEFEALRSALVKLHPTLIVPPIPDKHTLSDYAVKQSKAKEDATIIARRKRMLQSFLRRCAAHSEIRESEVLRKFLDSRWSWHEISTTPPISVLPKSNLKAPAANPAAQDASPAYASLPLPSSSSAQLRNPSQRFLDSEAFTNRFASHLSGSVEKANRRVARRWADSSGDFAELGVVLNSFSLSETGQLATAIERTGQASDSTCLSIGGLLQDWEQSSTEPLHEYVQFAGVLQKLLKWRHLKHLQFELAQDTLEAKKLKLDELERIEAEATRLERALETGGRSLTSGIGAGRGAGASAGSGPGSASWDSHPRTKGSIYGSAVENDDEESIPGRASESSNTYGSSGGVTSHSAGWSDGIGANSSSTNGSADGASRATDSVASAQSQGSSLSSPRASSRDRHRSAGSSGGGGGGGGYGLLSAITSSFSSMLDVDPESTRRREISRLREEILSLDEAVKLTASDLKHATQAIQADLDRFQRDKVRDFKEWMLNSARMHREFCKVNLANWTEAKEEIDRIDASSSGPHRQPQSWPSRTIPESSLTRSEQAKAAASSSSSPPAPSSRPTFGSAGGGSGSW